MYYELIIELPQTHAEKIAELLSDDSLLGVSILSLSLEDADANTPDEQPLFDEPDQPNHIPVFQAWQHSRMTVLIDDATIAPIILSHINTHLPDDVSATLHHELREVAEQDWVQQTQQQFSPIAVGQSLWIVPSWHTSPATSEQLTIALDPGLAFGTGSHPTTRMCLEWLEHYITPNCSTLDYGCGSGILAIAAAKLGATDVVGIDIDPQAVTAAQYNITTNHVNAHIGLTDDAQLNRQFDVVVANILANPLRLLAPLLCSKLNAAGKIILAGLLSEQAEELIAIYQRAGVTLRVWREQEGWATLTNTPASQ